MWNFAEWGNELHTGKRSYNIIGRRKVWYIISAIMIAGSAILLIWPGINPGIEFRGGSEFTISKVKNTDESIAVKILQPLAGSEPVRTSVVNNDSVRAQTERIKDAETTTKAQEELAKAYGVSVNQVTASYVGPTWGADVTGKALQAMVIFLILVSIVMALYFRAWRMALAAMLALLQDLIVTAGIYAAIGFEVTPATVIGFLTILGYSLYDTVVVFDKVRENTESVVDQTRYTYAEAANLAVNQTLVRSINTSIVALLPVGSILFIGSFLLGAGTLRDIALSLFIGIIVGAFSSVFIATPLEVTFRSREKSLVAQEAKVMARRAKVLEENPDAELDDFETGTLAHAGGHLGNQAQPRRRPRSRR